MYSFGHALGFLVVLGFAYIIWLLADKEKDMTRMIGRIISMLMVLAAIIMLGYGYFAPHHGFRGMYAHEGKGMQECQKDKMMVGKMDGMKMDKCEKMATKDVKTPAKK